MNHRLKNHAILFAFSAAVLVIAWITGADDGAADRLSIVSAYLCLALLGATLVYAPLQTIRGIKVPMNMYVRRDMGIWSAISGLLHFFLANTLSMNLEYVDRFVEMAGLSPSTSVRSQLYLWGTIGGYLIALFIILLLALSNDWMIRKLGLIRWKRLQRTGYVMFLLTIGHAFAFQLLESRDISWVIVVAVILVIVVGVRATSKKLLREHDID